MEPQKLSAKELAFMIDVPASTIDNIVSEKQGITLNVALKLGDYFETTPKFWVDLQISYELERAESSNKTWQEVFNEIKPTNDFFNEYDKCEELEDLQWSLRTKEVTKNGFLSNEESEDFLRSKLKD